MEKYGVDESETADLAKLASAGCPECGAKLEKHGNLYMCPTHGSEPFEAAKKAKE